MTAFSALIRALSPAHHTAERSDVLRLRLPFFSFACVLACTGDPQAAHRDRPGDAPPPGALAAKAKDSAVRTISAQGALLRLAALDTAVAWDAATRLVGDVDCDGVADSAFVGHSNSGVFVGLVRAVSASPEVLSFAVGSGIQQAVCSGNAVLTFESLDYDPGEAVGEIVGFHRSVVCKGLNLGDGDCDSIHMFWNTSTHHLDDWRA